MYMHFKTVYIRFCLENIFLNEKKTTMRRKPFCFKLKTLHVISFTSIMSFWHRN